MPRDLHQLPSIRVVKGARRDRGWRRDGAWRGRVSKRLGAAREEGSRALAAVVGMWPLIAALGLLFGLAWTIAMMQSP